MADEELELARTLFQAGTLAFERGEYRQSIESLEKAVNLAGALSALGGEAQIWLVNAYQAAGRSLEAIALCERLETHPNFKVRQQSRRLVYILKAPQLQRRPEWMSQIPDLSQIDEAGAENQLSGRSVGTSPPPRPRPSEPELIDLSQVNTKENGFIWLALVAIGLLLGGLFWFS